ncbi:DUF3243 family protein [Bacillus mangrovi]|uniref:DUF3243 family protein n=1 Tax=Metabacillus mangrovi TaxID=1491830 RepID=A0A7X2V4Z7_9BACI|nr:DUF3243 family protein [Metabacillus mangrovi]MTH53940.1 DUF3243 family protein [Metabacillus mangrovi]
MAFEKDTAVHQEKIEGQMDRMSKEEMDQVMQDFEEFKSYLHSKVSKGEKLGMSEDMLAKAAKITAEYLANNVEPRNREENLLKELWQAGNEEQRNHLSHVLVNLVKDKD